MNIKPVFDVPVAMNFYVLMLIDDISCWPVAMVMYSIPDAAKGSINHRMEPDLVAVWSMV